MEHVGTMSNKYIKNIYMENLHEDDFFFQEDEYDREEESNFEDEYNKFGKYAGTYAQDVEGFSDDIIDIAFDGHPDAYWNID